MNIRVSRWAVGILLSAAGFSILGRGGMGQAEPPVSSTPAAATQPASASAATLPSATGLLEGLLKDNPPGANPATPVNTNPNATPQIQAVAPGSLPPYAFDRGKVFTTAWGGWSAMKRPGRCCLFLIQMGSRCSIRRWG